MQTLAQLQTQLQEKIAQIDYLKQQIEGEYSLVKLINQPDPYSESDLKLMGCDFTNWPEECFDPELFVNDNAKY